ncbi:MAG: hypothetical protein RIM99_15920 [Cyclobacteriaceae bacterium]
MVYRILLIILVLDAKANGGPIDGSAVYKAGDIVLINKPDIQLIREDLKIKLDGNFSYVHVSYLLMNQGVENEDVEYGFPVDYIQTDLEYELNWKDDYLPEFDFYLDGETLTYNSNTTDETTSVTLTNYKGEPYKLDSKRHWKTTKFMIEGERTATLEVKYKIRNGFTDWSTSKDFFPTLDTRSLVYDFTPAQHWGNGKVNSLSVSIDATNVLKNRGSTELSGLSMKEVNGVFLFNGADYQLSESANIEISYNIENEALSKFAREHRLEAGLIKNVSVSSQLDGPYAKENMFDGNFSSAWVEGKTDNGTNEQIVIELDDFNLAAIGIVGGYSKSKSIYNSNNRIKKIKLEREVVNHGDPTKTSIESSEVMLEDLAFSAIPNDNNFYSILNLVGEYGEGYQKIRKVTITILETYEGQKYNDTCISEIFLMGYEWD